MMSKSTLVSGESAQEHRSTGATFCHQSAARERERAGGTGYAGTADHPRLASQVRSLSTVTKRAPVPE